MSRMLVPMLTFTFVFYADAAQLVVETDFPGGSGVLVSAEQDAADESVDLRLEPTDHPKRGWRAWWYVKISGCTPGKSIVVEVGPAPWATPVQAVFSSDQKEWMQTLPSKAVGKRRQYTVTPRTATVWVAWGPPFVLADAQKLVESVQDRCPHAKVFNLTESRNGHPTPAVRINENGASQNKPLVWLQARQHAWESGSSWVATGFADWIVSEDPHAQTLRKHAEIVLVPVMDVDNVQLGAGGKNQSPQDHNRDWSDAPHWRAVAAAQQHIKSAAQDNRLALFIDLHNPGANDKSPYFYVPPEDILSPQARENLTQFLALAKDQINGPLSFKGRTIPSGMAYDARAWKRISKNWVALLGTPAVTATLETAWNTPDSNVEGYRIVGRQLGITISHYLTSTPTGKE